MKNYYCLVAGLPEIRIDDNKLSFTIKEFKTELKEILSAKDYELAKLFFRQFDNKNLLAYLKNPDSELDPLGELSADDFAEILQLVKEEENPCDKRIPSYFKPFITAYQEEKPLIPEMSWEDQLATLYYDYALGCSNGFCASWFAFNLNVTNVFTAINCRNYDIELGDAIVGNNEVAQTIRESNSKDFGIAAMFLELEDVLRIADESNLFEREKKVDLLKWKWIEEHAFFKYFTIEKVFAYLLQLSFIERWVDLNKETGKKVFRDFVHNMQSSFDFPEEYKLNK